MSVLDGLAKAAGLQTDWRDAAGEPKRVAEEDLRRVLTRLGYPCDSEDDLRQSRRRLAEERRASRFLTADRGADCFVPVAQAAPGMKAGLGELTLEDGQSRAIEIERDKARFRIATAAIETPGYHRLRCGGAEYTIAVAPSRAIGVEEVCPDKQPWGVAVQTPSLRDADPIGFGDFGTLARAANAFAGAGADALAISPAHALFPDDAARFSPYAPSSRLFLNILLGDPRLIGAAAPDLPESALIDWEGATPAKLAALRAAWEARSPEVESSVARFRERGGEELERQALFDTLHAHFAAEGAHGWQDWPQAYHDPAGPAAARFAAENREEVDFYAFAQWLAVESLEAAQRAARGGGMAIGLISDLAVGMDAGGSQAWSRPDELLTGLSIGAPPDLLGPEGQDWGITGFSPLALRRTGFAGFIATIRAAMRSAGGVRIDHMLGLRRLWIVPHGASPKEGAYLTYPLDDMLRILALESRRAGAIVIGEDLGTVPRGLRPKMKDRNMLGMEVLWFQRGKAGAFLPPPRWRQAAAAMTGTHDLPTVAGWWRGRDLDWAWKLGRHAEDAVEAEDRRERAGERSRLWRACERAGVAEGSLPDADDTPRVVDAATRLVAEAPSALALFPLEDLVGLEEQPNLPGTIDEHPNWRRRMPAPAGELLEDEAIRRRADAITKARR